MRKFRSLRITLTIAFLALGLAVLIIASIFEIYFNYEMQKKVVAGQQQLIAKDAANTVESFVKEKISMMQTSAHLNNMVDADAQEQKLLLDRLLGFEPSFRRLILLDDKGQELAKVSRLSNIAQEQLTEQVRSNILSSVSNGDTYISSVYMDQTTSEPMIMIAVPIKDVFGDFKGILVSEVNLKFMWDLVGSIQIGNTGLVYVVDKQGNLIAYGDISHVLKRENLVNLPEVKKFVEGSASAIVGEDAAVSKGIKGNDVVSNYVPLGTPDWAVVVELPVQEAYGGIIHEIKLVVWIIFFSVSLTIAIGFYLSKKITGPIISLRNAAIEIGAGKLDTKIEVATDDEIGELAETFNQMIVELKKSKEHLEKYNEDLERNVKQRTMELSQKIIELKYSEKKFQDIALSSGDFIWETDKDGRYISASGNVQKIIGYTPEEIIGKSPFEIISKEEIDRVGAIFNESVLKKSPIHNLENWNITKDGRKVCLLTNRVPILDDKDDVIGYRGIDKDITERKNYEKEFSRWEDELVTRDKQLTEINTKIEEANIKLQALDKQKDEFISLAAHELKTPLTSIRGFAQVLLEKNELGDPENKHYLELINKNTDRLYTLVVDIVDSSRINLGKIIFNIEEIDPHKIFDDIKDDMSMTISKKGLTPEFTIEDGLPKINADFERTMQVLHNLMSNSIKFTEQGIISLNVKKDGEFVKFEVKDTGAGIPDENKASLFSRFYQVDSQLTRKVGGSGLGLSICKGLVEGMGGKIGFESTAGKGSTFHFTLPICYKG